MKLADVLDAARTSTLKLASCYRRRSFLSSRQIGEFAIAKRLSLIGLFGEFPKASGFIA